MKTLKTICLFLLLVSGVVKTDDNRYQKAMLKNISKIDSDSNAAAFIETSNNFERIALAEKDKWLPYYYAAYCYVIASYVDTVSEKKDIYLDKADQFIALADSLQPDESEIYVLKGMSGQARLQIDPMNRWMKYGAESSTNFQKAIQLDPSNPRPEYLIGMSLFYTPAQFGGGAQAAKPLIESSLKKFDSFVPEDELMPIWGKEMAEDVMRQITEQLPENKPE